MSANPFLHLGKDTNVQAALTLLGSSLVHGARAIAHINIAANVADGETVTIAGTTFEFDRAADGVVTGNIAVTGHADDTPANAGAALAAAINASGIPFAAMWNAGNGAIMVNYLVSGHYEEALSETMGGPGNTVDANFYGGAHVGGAIRAAFERVPRAQEVAEGEMHFLPGFVARKVEVLVRVTSTGAEVAWDGAYTVNQMSGMVAIDNSGAVDWATSHTVLIILTGSPIDLHDAEPNV